MCIGAAQAMPAPPPLPALPPPGPTPVSPEVVNAATEQKRRAAASGGYGSTIATSGAGLTTPAFTAGSQGFKLLTGT